MEDVEIKEAATNLARHIHDSKFDGIIVSGGSSSVSKAILYSAWRTLYPEEKVPKTITVSSEGNSLFYKRGEPNEKAARQEVVTEWININLPELWQLKDQKVCLVDELAVSGEKATKLFELFKGIGFDQLEVALFAASHNAELDEHFFIASKNPELLSKLWSATSRIQGQPHIDDSELPEGSDQEIRKRGLDDLRDMVHEIRK